MLLISVPMMVIDEDNMKPMPGTNVDVYPPVTK